MGDRNTTEIIVSKPIGILNREVQFDVRNFFKTLGKLLILLKSGSTSAFAEPINILDSFKFKEDPEGQAYVLILSSMLNAITELCVENRDNLGEILDAEDNLYENKLFLDFINKGVPELLENKVITISKSFLKNPKSLSIIRDFEDLVANWLKVCGVKDVNIINITNRLATYFVFQLNEQWKLNGDKFSSILLNLDTPFTNASQKELEWIRYNSFLHKQIDEPVFDEVFSLKQIYVPLNAFYILSEKHDEKVVLETNTVYQEKVNVVVDLSAELIDWTNNIGTNNPIKIISGGPGSGKSSFVKMLSAKIAADKKIKVLFIPLHLFNIKEDIHNAIGDFVLVQGILSFNPLDDATNSDKLLIVFDGLDELAKQGKAGGEVAKQFYDELCRFSNLYNQHSIRLLILISGRELAIQMTSDFRDSKQLYHLLPYFTAEIARKYYRDKLGLLESDKRDAWWKTYGLLKGHAYEGMPTELLNMNLDEITSQPLLNYLVALSKERGAVKFSKNTNLNEIYEDLIRAVYERKYETTHSSITAISEEDFIKVMEEIAISAWHGGDSRTTTVKRINEYIESSGLTKLIDTFQQDVHTGVTRLLTAFYFRQKDLNSDGDKTFEFTHKSFGEYLVSRRLVRMLKNINIGREENKMDNDRGFSERECLIKWSKITRESLIDIYLWRFIKYEIRRCDVGEVYKWQKTIIELIEYLLRKGMPVHEIRTSYYEESKMNRNSEESLLILLNACALKSEKISKIKWNSGDELNLWLGRLNFSQSIDFYSGSILSKCMSYLDLEKCDLSFRIFNEVNFSNCNLVETNFLACGFYMVTFDNSSLNECNFMYSYLYQCSFRDSNLSNADFDYSLINTCFFNKANVLRVSFENTFFKMGAAFQRDLQTLTIEQLATARTLYLAKGLPKRIKMALVQVKPDLFKKSKE